MNHALSFCKITASSKIFSRNFYLPLLKPLTPKDALRTFRITGKWLLGSKIQHYIPVLHDHKKKRSKKLKNYGKIRHEHDRYYTYMTPCLDPDNVESHKLLADVLNSKRGKGAYVYTVDDKKYNLVLDAPTELAIREGEIIDVLISQRNDKILMKMKDFKKVPVEIVSYEGKETLYRGEGATGPEEEKFHHHGKYTMSIAKIFEEMENREEGWEKELKRILGKRKKQPGEGTKDWNDMLKSCTENLDWNKFEKDAKKLVEFIEEPIIEHYFKMEIEDFERTANVNEIVSGNNEIFALLPTLQEIPEVIENLANATEFDLTTEDGRTLSGVKLTLESGREIFLVGQMVDTYGGFTFVPGQTVENEFGTEFAPGITVNVDDDPMLVTGLILQENDGKGAIFVPTECTVTAQGNLAFTTTQEERTKYKLRKVPKRKVQQFADTGFMEEDYILEDDEDEDADDEEIRRRRIAKLSRMNEGENVDDLLHDEEVTERVLTPQEIEDKELEELERKITEWKLGVDPRVKAHQEIIEMERESINKITEKIVQLVECLEAKTEELKDMLEELRNLTVIPEISPISTAMLRDAEEICADITDDPKHAMIISDLLLTMVRRVRQFPDKYSINVESIGDPNSIQGDGGTQRREKLKIALKTALAAAANVFRNRPQDEISALKAIGTVLVLALRDQQALNEELCGFMETADQRHFVCDHLLKELTLKRGNKLKTLKLVVNLSDQNILDPSILAEKLRGLLDDDYHVLGLAFKKIVKNNDRFLENVIEFVRRDVCKLKTENYAAETLQNAIVNAVKKTMDELVRDFVKNATEDEIKDVLSEALAFGHVLALNGIAHDLSKLESYDRLPEGAKKLLRRLLLMRKLAENDAGFTKVLTEVRKNPDFGKTNPRMRQLVRESAGLMTNGSKIRNSKEIPSRFLEEDNLIALEDYLVQRSVLTLPVLVSKNGRQAVIPRESETDVLQGTVPYSLIDEEGVDYVKAVQKLTNFKASDERDALFDDFTKFGSLPEKSQRMDGWAETPKFDVRNRIRRGVIA